MIPGLSTNADRLVRVLFVLFSCFMKLGRVSRGKCPPILRSQVSLVPHVDHYELEIPALHCCNLQLPPAGWIICSLGLQFRQRCAAVVRWSALSWFTSFISFCRLLALIVLFQSTRNAGTELTCIHEKKNTDRECGTFNCNITAMNSFVVARPYHESEPCVDLRCRF